METETSKSDRAGVPARPLATPGLVVLALVLVAGCGGGARGASGTTRTAVTTRSVGAASPGGAFAWLSPRAAPARWPVATIPSGAALAYPPGWRRIGGDPGTATVVLSEPEHPYMGYLNVTPRQGDESLGNWATFRVSHNAEEGDRHVRTLAAAGALRFRSARGACVKDAYTTSTGRGYVELACLVSGPRSASVIVGAAPPSAWPRMAPVIEQAISAFKS